MTEQEERSLLLQNQLCFPLYAAARRVVALYAPFLKPLGLTYTQYITFMVLWEQGTITVGELGKRLFLDNGTITPLLKKMERSGFVTRTRSMEDERVVIIQITEKGMDMKEKCKDIPKSVGGCIRLEPEAAASLYKLLYSIIEN